MSVEPAGAALDFQRVYDEFQARIRRYLARLAGAAEADDLTQETFARVSHALAGFRGEAALSTWIYRIATNVALDRARSPGFQLQAHAAEPEALAALGTAPTIEQDVARQEMSECVRDYVDQLPPDYRTVVVLSELEELPDREIAEILGISLETAKIRLHRARARLRQLLELGCSFSRDERNELTCEPRPDDVSSAD
ncbi:MAG TPA: RNA polymerase sigma factor [Methylomirabilota bacterium]|nr:RNA polymerase sigma factor [Methylomirabilota bacterium]